MWHLTDRERAILRKVIPTEFMQQPVKMPNGSEAESIESLSKKGGLSTAMVDAMYNSLPPETEFYQFVEALRPCSIEEAAKAAEEQLTEQQKEAKKSYRERVEKLKHRQENKLYAEMTKSIDPTRARPLMEDFGKEMRQVNRQLVAVMNTLITVGGSFAFGFFGVQFAYPHLNLDIGTRMLLGLIPATLVFFADLYFLIKGLE